MQEADIYFWKLCSEATEGRADMEKKINKNTKFRTGIMMKILFMALGPLLMLAVISTVFSARTIRVGMEEEAIKRLEDITNGVHDLLPECPPLADQYCGLSM